MAFTPKQQMAHLRQRARDAEELAKASCADPSGREAIAMLMERNERLERQRDEAIEARDRERLRADREAEKRRAAELAQRRAEGRADRHQRENERLREEVEGLRGELQSLCDDVAEAVSALTEAQDDQLEWMRRALQAEKVVDMQRARLNRSPENSSRPPSSDPNRKKQEKKKKKIANSREETERKKGGQEGHRGHGRKYHRPDEYIDVTPTGKCPCCGGELEPFGKASERHVTELYMVSFTKAYVGKKCRCGKCGEVVKQEWPADAPNEENWGVTVKAILAVLCGWLNASIDKAREFLRDATHGEVDVSKGFVSNSMREFSGDAAPLLDAIEQAVRGSPVVGCDATFTRTNGKTSYVYVFHSPEAAIFRGSATKGIEPLVGSPISGNDPGQVVCHDHDVSFYSREVKAGLHAECNAHASRYLKGVAQNEPDRAWASEMRALLGVAHDLAESCRAEGREPDHDELRGIALGYLAALDLGEEEYLRDGPFEGKYKPEGIALMNRLRAFIDEHLMFLLNPDVPYTNNASERLIRCVKSKTKQSGGFRSEEAKQWYCDFLSVAKTARLHGMGAHDVATAVFGSKGC